MKESPALRDIPVIMATAKGTEYDKIQSLDLVSRVKAVLCRCGGKEKPVLILNALSLDTTGAPLQRTTSV